MASIQHYKRGSNIGTENENLVLIILVLISVDGTEVVAYPESTHPVHGNSLAAIVSCQFGIVDLIGHLVI